MVYGSYSGGNFLLGLELQTGLILDDQGPCEDAAGQSMMDCARKPGNCWDDEDSAPYGTELMGGYPFVPLEGERNTRENAVRSGR